MPTQPLSLAEVVKLALARNPSRTGAAARVDQALAALEGAESVLEPHLSIDGSLSTGDAPSSYLFKHIDAHALPSGSDFNDPGWFSNVEAGITIRWNLWNGGRDTFAIRAAASELEARRADLEAFDESLALLAASAVLDARSARELGVAARASATALESEGRDLSARVDRGAALRSEALSLEVRRAAARESAIQAELAERLAIAALRRLLALAPEDAFELADEAVSTRAEPRSLAESVHEALERRSELESARRSLDAARARRELAARSWLPRLDLEAREYADDVHPGLDFSRPNTQLGLALNFDLFDGGARRSGERAAQAIVRELESRELESVHSVEFDVQRAWLARDGARARCEVTRAAILASEESFELVRKEFEAGSVPVTRFLEAESARTNAATDDVRARLDLERAEFELARARGIRIDRWLDAGVDR